MGMTQIFDKDGRAIPVTVIESGPCVVLQHKTKKTDGYDAIQLGFAKPLRFIREIRGEFPYKLGDEVKVSIFQEGEYVDITGISKGKGFAGGMKRWGWAGGGASHGSMSHRRIGSVGQGTSPGRVFKGKTMPGHMGFRRVTVQNLKIIKVDSEHEILLVKGAIPGVKGGYLLIRTSIKM